MGVYENIHQDTYLNVAKAAEFLKIHPESVRRLYRQGKLNGFKVGKALLFPKPYLIQFAKTYDPRPGNIERHHESKSSTNQPDKR